MSFFLLLAHRETLIAQNQQNLLKVTFLWRMIDQDWRDKCPSSTVDPQSGWIFSREEWVPLILFIDWFMLFVSHCQDKSHFTLTYEIGQQSVCIKHEKQPCLQETGTQETTDPGNKVTHSVRQNVFKQEIVGTHFQLWSVFRIPNMVWRSISESYTNDQWKDDLKDQCQYDIMT